MALNGLVCADVPLSNYSLTPSWGQTPIQIFDRDRPCIPSSLILTPIYRAYPHLRNKINLLINYSVTNRQTVLHIHRQCLIKRLFFH